jgi:hypothetical protein
MSKFLVVEGFGDFTAGLQNCEAVKVITELGSEAEAIRFAASHYESAIWGEDADGFSMTDDSRMAFFTLVRTAEEMATM